MYHYTTFLPNVGRQIERNGSEIVCLIEKLENLEREVQRAKRAIEFEEAELFDYVRTEWTMDEIQAAREMAKKRNS